MTYLITPYHEAIPIHEHQHYIVYDGPDYAVVQTNRFHGGPSDCNISPKFLYSDYQCDDITDDEAKSEAIYYATVWLEDLLIRLSKNPILIHCTSDGEMFTK